MNHNPIEETKMTYYYAVCNVNGPISVRLEAKNHDEAIEKFEQLDAQTAIDRARTDAEDDLDICGDGMSEDEFSDTLEAAGLTPVCDLAEIVNAHAGTVAHEANGWYLWAATTDAPPRCTCEADPANRALGNHFGDCLLR